MQQTLYTMLSVNLTLCLQGIRVAIATTSPSSTRAVSNSPFEHVTEVILEDFSSELPSGQLIQSLAAKFGKKLLVLSALGVVGIIMSKHRVPVLLELVNDNDDSNIDASIRTVSEKIVKETKSVEMDKYQYGTRLKRQLKTV